MELQNLTPALVPLAFSENLKVALIHIPHLGMSSFKAFLEMNIGYCLVNAGTSW